MVKSMVRSEELKAIEEGVFTNGYVYVLLTDNNIVKIGKTRKPYDRIKYIETVSGHNIVDWYISDMCGNYSELELEMHSMFNQFRIKGEWFRCDFNKVVKSLIQSPKIYNNKIEKSSKKRDNFLNLLLMLSLFSKANEMHPEYDFDKWDQNEEDCLIILNGMNLSLNLFCKDKIALAKNIDTVKNNIKSKESRKIMQDIVFESVNTLGYEWLSNECYEKLDFITRVLGITEVLTNPFLPDDFRFVMNVETHKDLRYVSFTALNN